MEGLSVIVDGFLNATFDPVVVISEYGYVLFAKMVVVVTCMLEHCGFVFSKGVGGRGCMFVESGCSCALGFSYISARAWCEVCSCTRYVIDMAYCFALA